MVKNLPGYLDFIPGSGRSPGKGIVYHSSILAWRIPWTGQPAGLQSMGWQTIRHDWSNLSCMQATIRYRSIQGTKWVAQPENTFNLWNLLLFIFQNNLDSPRSTICHLPYVCRHISDLCKFGGVYHTTLCHREPSSLQCCTEVPKLLFICEMFWVLL